MFFTGGGVWGGRNTGGLTGAGKIIGIFENQIYRCLCSPTETGYAAELEGEGEVRFVGMPSPSP